MAPSGSDLDEVAEADGDPDAVGAESDGSDGALEGEAVEDGAAAEVDEEGAGRGIDGEEEVAVGGGGDAGDVGGGDAGEVARPPPYCRCGIGTRLLVAAHQAHDTFAADYVEILLDPFYDDAAIQLCCTMLGYTIYGWRHYPNKDIEIVLRARQRTAEGKDEDLCGDSAPPPAEGEDKEPSTSGSWPAELETYRGS